MKTGYDATDDGDKLTETQFDLISLYLKLLQKAMDLAAIYCTHAGRQVVNSSDLMKALRYQARYFLSESTENTLQEAREDLLDVMMSDDIEEEEDDEQEDDEEENGQDDISCDCDKCTMVNSTTEEWESWNPDDEILQYLKMQVDRMEGF
jgi:hypothetical protein